MVTRTLSRVGAIAVLPLLSITGCAPATIGVSPEVILSTVMATLPRAIPTSSGSSGGGGSTRARIPASPAPSSAASSVLRTADSYRGIRYVWGGNTPNEGFDCSGFTKYIFAKHSIALPRTSREQSRVGTPIAADFRALRPGDLMFFAEPGEAISHVAIYAGNGRIIHSSSSVGGVGYTDLNTGGEWFVAYFVAARRIL
ncbi:MAG TPA: C40 family peptidase [Gemmatimonadaceae bacterium]|jgi:cell wall-associated NlpC family hydrolase